MSDPLDSDAVSALDIFHGFRIPTDKIPPQAYLRKINRLLDEFRARPELHDLPEFQPLASYINGEGTGFPLTTAESAFRNEIGDDQTLRYAAIMNPIFKGATNGTDTTIHGYTLLLEQKDCWWSLLIFDARLEKGRFEARTVVASFVNLFGVLREHPPAGEKIIKGLIGLVANAITRHRHSLGTLEPLYEELRDEVAMIKFNNPPAHLNEIKRRALRRDNY